MAKLKLNSEVVVPQKDWHQNTHICLHHLRPLLSHFSNKLVHIQCLQVLHLHHQGVQSNEGSCATDAGTAMY